MEPATESPFHADRLLELANYVEDLPSEELDMSEWECGTTACAIGHACRMPYFQALGLRLSSDDEIITPIYRDRYFGYNAVAALFGITKEAALVLFGCHNKGKTVHEVAANIRVFVEQRSKKPEEPHAQV